LWVQHVAAATNALTSNLVRHARNPNPTPYTLNHCASQPTGDVDETANWVPSNLLPRGRAGRSSANKQTCGCAKRLCTPVAQAQGRQLLGMVSGIPQKRNILIHN